MHHSANGDKIFPTNILGRTQMLEWKWTALGGFWDRDAAYTVQCRPTHIHHAWAWFVTG